MIGGMREKKEKKKREIRNKTEGKTHPKDRKLRK
jgi:hypothetical protein